MTRNGYAFLAMTGACEGAEYSTLYGGGTFDSFADHPRQSITAGGYTSTAAGRYQILARTWDDFIRDRGPRKFDQQGQDECALWLIDRRGATADMEAGRLEAAILKCGKEWASFPGSPYGQKTRALQFCLEHYLANGGQLSTQTAAPIDDRSTQASPADVSRIGGADNSNSVTQGTQMPIAAIISLFGSVLADLIPQLTAIFKPKGEVAQRNTALAQTAIDTILKVTGQPNVQAAIEQMQADAAVKTNVTQALVTHPDIMPFVEVGGGVAAARESDLKVMTADKPFWKTSAVFWVSVMLVPMVLWYVGSSIVGGVDIPVDWPWYGQILLKLFGTGWSADARAGLANLVVGLVLGGICGVYFGVSVTQAKQAVPPSTNNTGA